MKLFQIDALQLDAAGNVCGMLTAFLPQHAVAPAQQAWLRRGFLVDAYAVEAELTEEESRLLIGLPWPTLPIDELIAIAKDPRRAAQSQLAEILAARGRGCLAAQDRQAELDEVFVPAEATGRCQWPATYDDVPCDGK